MLEIVKTGDGSNTIFNSEVGENYHSKHGALQESRHVFIKSGLEYFLENKKMSPATESLEAAVSILEVGFGTGLNFLLSAAYCNEQGISLNYTGIEAYPLTESMIAQTGYDKYIPETLWREFITAYPLSLTHRVTLNSRCRLRTAHCKLVSFLSTNKFNIIYFDAFAATYQPEMWNEAAISHTLRFLEPGGVFVTYAITGNLKRMIKGLGLKVEKVPGAPGKREMLRAY